MSPWRRFVDRMPAAQRPVRLPPTRLVCFDLDGVLLEQESSWVTVHRHFGVENEESLHAFLRGEIDDHEFIRRDVALWKRLKPDVTIHDIQAILGGASHLMPAARETVKALHERGVRTAIVSGGIDLVAHDTARTLGIPLVSANGLRHDREGRLLGDGVVGTPLGRKSEVVRRFAHELGIPLGAVASVGNSSPDLSMFHVSGLAIAFRPTDEFVVEGADVVVRGPSLKEILAPLLGPT